LCANVSLSFQAFQEKVITETDPGKLAMYKRMDAAIKQGVQNMETAANNGGNEEEAKQVS